VGGRWAIWGRKGCKRTITLGKEKSVNNDRNQRVSGGGKAKIRMDRPGWGRPSTISVGMRKGRGYGRWEDQRCQKTWGELGEKGISRWGAGLVITKAGSDPGKATRRVNIT